MFDVLWQHRHPVGCCITRLAWACSCGRLFAYHRLTHRRVLTGFTILGLLSDAVTNLAHNINLRSVNLQSGNFFRRLRDQDGVLLPRSADWVVSLLSRITSPDVSEIILPMTMHDPFVLDQVDWLRMDEILTQDLWRNSLRTVTIELHLPFLTEALIGEIRGHFLKLSAISNVVFTVRSRQPSWKG